MPQRLKHARMSRGLTQGQLAERVGVSTQTVSNWETGLSEPSRRHLAAVLAALGNATLMEVLSPVEFEGLVGMKPPPAPRRRGRPRKRPELLDGVQAEAEADATRRAV